MLDSFRITGPTEFAPGYMLIPTGGLTAYVHASGAAALDKLPAGMPDADLGFHTSLNLAAAACRASRGDNIVILEGHTQTLAGADAVSNMKAGTRIWGRGFGSERPTFRFGAGATDQLKLNDANVWFDNCIFGNSASAVDTTLGIDVTGTDNRFTRCLFYPSDFGAVAQKTTTMLRLSSGANNFRFDGCTVLGGATTAFTDTFLINAACNNVVVRNCYFSAQLGTAEGLITCATAAATNLQILDSYFANLTTASTVALKAMAAVTGFVDRVGLYVLQGTVTAMNGTTLPEPTMAAAINTPGALAIGRDVWVANAGKFGVLPAVVTATLP